VKKLIAAFSLVCCLASCAAAPNNEPALPSGVTVTIYAPGSSGGAILKQWHNCTNGNVSDGYCRFNDEEGNYYEIMGTVILKKPKGMK